MSSVYLRGRQRNSFRAGSGQPTGGGPWWVDPAHPLADRLTFMSWGTFRYDAARRYGASTNAEAAAAATPYGQGLKTQQLFERTRTQADVSRTVLVSGANPSADHGFVRAGTPGSSGWSVGVDSGQNLYWVDWGVASYTFTGSGNTNPWYTESAVTLPYTTFVIRRDRGAANDVRWWGRDFLLKGTTSCSGGTNATTAAIQVATSAANGIALIQVWEKALEEGEIAAILADPYQVLRQRQRAIWVVAAASDTTAPTWPGGSAITSSSVTHNAFNLAWDAATDDTAVTQYRYRIDGGSWTNTSTTRSASISSKTPGTTYAIEVAAGDAADNWSTALTLDVTTQSLKLNPSLYNPADGTARTSQTGLGVLVLGEKPGSASTPTVLAYSATETTDGSGVLDVNLNSSGKSPGDVVWLVAVKSDGVPANSGYSLCWPVAVVAV